mmetsp:Transcript_13874/g.48323  ORF Transcript_13874/g.48323 Transcript_13874/m.48323 type:complete len:491 (-) Transcript_13874:4878-6350(-)
MGIAESSFRKPRKGDGVSDGKTDTELWVSVKAKTTCKRTRAVHKKKVAFLASTRGMSIGSSTEADLSLDDANLNPMHACLRLTDDGMVHLEAFGRTYFLIGQGIKSAGLHQIVKDQVVKMGACSLQVTETCVESQWRKAAAESKAVADARAAAHAREIAERASTTTGADGSDDGDGGAAGGAGGAGEGKGAEADEAASKVADADAGAGGPSADDGSDDADDADFTGLSADAADAAAGGAILELNPDDSDDSDHEDGAPASGAGADEEAAVKAVADSMGGHGTVMMLENDADAPPAPPTVPAHIESQDPGMCYICFDDSNEAGNELVNSPCSCAKLVHRTCLSKWIATKGSRLCSICKSKLPIDFTVDAPYLVLQVVRHMRGLHWSGEREYIISFNQRRNNVVTVGSGQDCDLNLPDPSLSRCHSRIVFRDDAFYVEDLMSSAGTFLRVAEPHRIALDATCQFKLGRTNLTVKAKRKRSLLRWRSGKKKDV